MTNPHAAKAYYSFLKQWMFFSNQPIEDLTILEVYRFISTFQKRYAPKSVYFMIAILKDYFKYYPNIINPHHIRSPRLGLPDIHYLKEEEFKVIDGSLSEKNETEIRNKLIHHILWNTGIRVGELCSIHLDNIDLKTRHAKIITEKSIRVAYIMWNEYTHELLINYLGFRLQRDGDFLFDISPRAVQRMVKSIAERVGIEGITPHKYRHGKAHKMIRDGGSIDDVSFVLRHSNPALTKQMYLRLDKEENLAIMGRYV